MIKEDLRECIRYAFTENRMYLPDDVYDLFITDKSIFDNMFDEIRSRGNIIESLIPYSCTLLYHQKIYMVVEFECKRRNIEIYINFDDKFNITNTHWCYA